MKKINRLVFITIIFLFKIVAAQDYQKIAQTGMQFLSVVSDAKAASMAEAMTSLPFESSSLFFNPAGMADMESTIDVAFSSNQWIADINHLTFSAAYKPFDGDLGTIGMTVQSVDYGSFIGTVLNTGEVKGYEDTRIFSLSASAIGVGYAKQLTDRFSVGVQVRYVHQDLGRSRIYTETVEVQGDTASYDSLLTTYKSNEVSPFVFDFGTQYKTGIKSLVFGMSVRNFSRETKYAEEGFQAPLVFNLGVSMDLMDLVEAMPFDQKLIMSVDANHHQDKEEQLKIGFQYEALSTLALRAGYISGEDLSGFSFGFGIRQYGFAFDYSYTPTDLFENVQRLTGRFSF